MTEYVTIPTTVDEAIARLKAVDRLMFAQDWERAAIVSAFVELPGSGSHNKQNRSSEVLNPEQFGAVGLAGLKSANTIRRYVEAWQSTGRPRPKLGETVDLEGLGKFPPGETTKAAVKKNMVSVLALLDDPEYVLKLVGRMSDESKSLVIEAIAKSRPQIEGPAPTPTLPRPWSIDDAKSKVLAAVESLIRDAIAEHPEGYGDSAEGHARDVSRYTATLVSFVAWLLNPSQPYSDPAEFFDLVGGPLFVEDIIGGAR